MNGSRCRSRHRSGAAEDGLNQLWETGVPMPDAAQPGGRVNTLLKYQLSNGSAPYWRMNSLEGRHDLAAGISYRLMDHLDLRSEAMHRRGEIGWGLRGRIQH